MALEIPFGAKNKSLEISPTVSYILNFQCGDWTQDFTLGKLHTPHGLNECPDWPWTGHATASASQVADLHRQTQHLHRDNTLMTCMGLCGFWHRIPGLTLVRKFILQTLLCWGQLPGNMVSSDSNGNSDPGSGPHLSGWFAQLGTWPRTLLGPMSTMLSKSKFHT